MLFCVVDYYSVINFLTFVFTADVGNVPSGTAGDDDDDDVPGMAFKNSS